MITYNMSRWKQYFAALWSGQALSLFGSTLVDFALIWYMTTLTGSAVVLTTAALVGMLPTIFISPILGSLVDRWKRRTMMILADGLTALFTILLAGLFWIDAVQIWHIYVLLFVRSITGFTHFLAMDTATSLMVPHEQLTRVAGLNRTLMGIMAIAGPPVGAFFLTIMPVRSVLLIDVGTALIAILPLLFIVLPEPDRTTAPAGKPARITLLDDILVGFRYIRAWKGLVALILVAVVANFMLQPIFSLIPLLVTRHFKGGALELGWLETAIGAGTVLGGLILSSWGGFKKKIFTTLLGGLMEGTSILVIAFSPASGFWIALGGFFLLGLALAMVDGPIMAIFQTRVAPEIQGRVLSFMISAGRVAAPAGLLLSGIVTDAFGVRVWFFIAGFGWLAAILLGLASPALIRIEEKRAGEELEPLIDYQS